MPILGVIASSINLGGGSWVNWVIGASANDQYPSMFSDSSFNSYLTVSKFVSGSTRNPMVVKFTPAGAISWQRQFTMSGTSTITPGGGVDSSGNVYFSAYDNGPSSYQVYSFKLDSAGNEVVQTRYNTGNSSNTNGRAFSVSPNGSVIYLATIAGANLYPNAVRYNTSLNLQHQTGTNETSGQNYACVAFNDGTMLTSLGSSNTSLLGPSQGSWQWSISNAGTGNGFSCTNSSGEIYSLNQSGTNAFIQRINPATGASVWTRQLTGMSATSQHAGVAANASFNYALYVVETTRRLLIVKRANSDGSVIWQRTITASGGNEFSTITNTSSNGMTISVDAADKFFYINNVYPGVGNYQTYLWKLPADGSKTGSVALVMTTATYAASSYTDGSTTSSRPASSVGPVNPSLTSAASTLSISSSTDTTRTNYPL